MQPLKFNLDAYQKILNNKNACLSRCNSLATQKKAALYARSVFVAIAGAVALSFMSSPLGVAVALGALSWSISYIIRAIMCRTYPLVPNQYEELRNNLTQYHASNVRVTHDGEEFAMIAHMLGQNENIRHLEFEGKQKISFAESSSSAKAFLTHFVEISRGNKHLEEVNFSKFSMTSTEFLDFLEQFEEPTKLTKLILPEFVPPSEEEKEEFDQKLLLQLESIVDKNRTLLTITTLPSCQYSLSESLVPQFNSLKGAAVRIGVNSKPYTYEHFHEGLAQAIEEALDAFMEYDKPEEYEA